MAERRRDIAAPSGTSGASGIPHESAGTPPTTSTPILVLASASPRRQELIRTLGLGVLVRPAHVDETADGSPAELVETLSLRKALAAARQFVDGDSRPLVIGSDTIVVLDGEVLGKPSGPEDAVRMLARMQGKTHEVYTGLACLDAIRLAEGGTGLAEGLEALAHPAGRSAPSAPLPPAAEERLGEIGRFRMWERPRAAVGHTVSRVTFRPMSRAEIEAYVRTGEPLDKAGAYGVQGIGAVFIEKIEGDFFSVMGLPLNLLYRVLAAFGVSPFEGS